MQETDAKDMIDSCNACGICNPDCPVYSVLLNESASPRFKVFLAKKGENSSTFFLCTNCQSCLANCPSAVSLDIIKIRHRILKHEIEVGANKIMRNNILRFGNPFGEMKPGLRQKFFFT